MPTLPPFDSIGTHATSPEPTQESSPCDVDILEVLWELWVARVFHSAARHTEPAAGSAPTNASFDSPNARECDSQRLFRVCSELARGGAADEATRTACSRIVAAAYDEVFVTDVIALSPALKMLIGVMCCARFGWADIPTGQIQRAADLVLLFLRKYEIHHRLVIAYQAEGKRCDVATSEDCQDYLLFSCVLLMEQARTADPRYLNAALKVLDAVAGAALCRDFAGARVAKSLVAISEQILVTL